MQQHERKANDLSKLQYPLNDHQQSYRITNKVIELKFERRSFLLIDRRSLV